MPTASARSAVGAQPDFERLDVARTADVALVAKPASAPRKNTVPGPLGAGRQLDRHRVADAHMVDVRLLDVGADQVDPLMSVNGCWH